MDSNAFSSNGDGRSLAGHVALVTGSSRGLGRQIAIELGRAGAKVAVNYFNSPQAAETVQAELQSAGAECCLVHGDATSPDDVRRMCDEAREQLGPIDILVVNATCDQPELPFEQYDWAFFQRMQDYFVKSPVLLMQQCLPHMKRQRWGRIIHITSEVFAIGNAPFSAYVSAKGGQVGLARSTAKELAPFGITVNMVAPGWIPVERHADYPQEQKDAYVARLPAGRFGTPEDVAPTVVFLAGDGASFINGQTIHVNGANTVF